MAEIKLPRWGKSATIGKLAAALAAAQAKIEPAKKNAINPHFRSGYADFRAVVEAGAPIHEHGLSVSQMPIGACSMLTMLMHESGEYLWAEADMRPRDPANPQAVGSCQTYMRRYGYAAALGISTGDDDDGNAATADNKSNQGTKGEGNGW